MKTLTSIFLAIILIIHLCLLTANKTEIKIDNNLDTLSINQFLDSLSFVESSNRHYISNGNYHGKYQISSIWIKKWSKYNKLSLKKMIKNFLNDENEQHRIITILCKENWKCLKKYKDKIVKNIVMTEGSLLAMSHLSGVNNTIKWITSNGNIITSDNLGTNQYVYAKKFNFFIRNY